MVNGRNIHYQPIKMIIKLMKILDTVQGDHYLTGCLLDYYYFKGKLSGRMT